ncbi:MAG TPA: TRAP transporter large permease subunit [Thermococcus sp.]|nr:MAG: TRAP transporter permease DctM/Q [Thermococci archaeon]HDH44151.1 TRAP transporter large permease subunit [Thermococcus sp.]
MNVEVIIFLMLFSLIVLLFSGLPLVFTLGSLGIIFSYLLWGHKSLFMVANQAFSVATTYFFVAIPLYVFMADVLRHSGVIEDLYAAMYRWIGHIRGGLSMGTVLICTIMAAMTGIVGAATTAMGLIALPPMLKRGYKKEIALGSIAAGGTLGILIPPSVITIVYAQTAGESIGKMFMGGVFPGLLLSGLFIAYIGIRCLFQPHLAPPAPPNEVRVSWKEKFASLKALVLPSLIILGVLGSIYFGIATPTEAAGVGAIGAIISSLVYRRFNWRVIKESCYDTLRVTSMIIWITIAARIFISAFNGVGGVEFVKHTIASLPFNRWIILIIMQLSLVFYGLFLDEVGIILLCVPLYVPIIKALGFNTLWFGILFLINAQMDYITPPFGYTLFYLKGVVPKGITMGDIYRSVVPFVALQALALTLCIIFPDIILWLPNTMKGG